MDSDRPVKGPDVEKPRKGAYRKPEIVEWGSVVDMTGNFLNGDVDPNFGVGGTVPGFRAPPPGT